MNNNENTTQTVEETPVLTPMEGVTIAPAQEGPVNASNSATATEAYKPTNPTETVPVVQPPVVEPTIVQPPVQPTVPPVVPAQPVTPPPIPPQQPVLDLPKPVKQKKNFTPILLIIVIALIGYIVYSSNTHKMQIDNLNYNCTPITASKEDIKLDLNSTLVQDLYSKVYTTIREDIAEPNFNNSMKLYLAFRQIPEKDLYTTNCNLFDSNAMEPYTCEVSTTFAPRAFKEEKLVLELKKLFGEKTYIPLGNIQLGRNTCIGGFQYIEKRGEFVEGYCNQKTATSFKATKTLLEATSNKNTIILKEEVKYHENEKMQLPEYLKSGYYYYTFRLDMNYNYVLVSKTYESKY